MEREAKIGGTVTLVILESPYAGDIERNLLYARRAMRHSLLHGEAPIASHLLYTQVGVLDDRIPAERQLGIDAGLAWGPFAAKTVVYEDYGISPGMRYGIRNAEVAGREVMFRGIGQNQTRTFGPQADFSIMASLEGFLKLATRTAHQANAKWWVDLQKGEPLARNVGELLMLCVSELAEGMEGHRKSLMDDKLPHRSMLEVELADCLIRILDMAGGLGLDLPGAFREKMEFNAQREDHKLEARRAANGKKY